MSARIIMKYLRDNIIRELKQRLLVEVSDMEDYTNKEIFFDKIRNSIETFLKKEVSDDVSDCNLRVEFIRPEVIQVSFDIPKTEIELFLEID